MKNKITKKYDDILQHTLDSWINFEYPIKEKIEKFIGIRFIPYVTFQKKITKFFNYYLIKNFIV